MGFFDIKLFWGGGWNGPRGIQLLRLHLGRGGGWGGGVSIKMQTYETRGRGGPCQCKRLPINFVKGQTFTKKEYRNGQKFWLKVEKDREQ